MIHLSSFEAIHYRGIDGLSLPELNHVNLITGVNGVGKTALIEAISQTQLRQSACSSCPTAPNPVPLKPSADIP